ncbi:hypothetical protein R5R35_001647 [Gryllus longicercus]|uniref:Protein kinase domain-containing protein n=1 Tax=Gryllus longicercus TaxID=2509291 RepID=A0AAN9VL24_9ORTH
MGTVSRKALGGSIHRIREFELEKVCLSDEFDILQIVGEGWFGKILLAEHRHTDTEMVLKALPKQYTALRDFYREFHYGLHLAAHRNIITTYDVAFETAGFYVFAQEYAPLGDLTSNVSETGIGETHSKRVARQLASALEHMHTRDLVHRDVKLDNVLVLRSDFSRVKLCDFGETRRVNTLVRRRNEWLPYTPPEVLLTNTDETYKADTSHDVWQFAIVVFVCLTGCLPWQKAGPDDPRYVRYVQWQASNNVIMMPVRRPKLFKQLSSRAQRLFRKYLEPRPEKRPKGLADLQRFLDDRWLGGRVSAERGGAEDDELCPSMYSYHSSAEEKDKLLFTLTQYGIETTVDRSAKKDRIREWIQSSVIEEEGEEEAEDEDVEEEREEREENGTFSPRLPPRAQPLSRHASGNDPDPDGPEPLPSAAAAAVASAAAAAAASAAAAAAASVHSPPHTAGSRSASH